MLITKLRSGILCLETPQGVRYVRPTLLQRVQLLWLFRHFNNVPSAVLSRAQSELIEYLRTEGQFVYVGNETVELVLLGTVEFAPPIAVELPEKKSAQRAFAAASSTANAGAFITSRNVSAMPER